ncbi:3-oxoadipyl-CoA thiolase [Colwelliaceae bacterium 6441]
MNNTNNAIIYDGLRSPFGRHGGILAKVRPDDLMAAVISKLIERNSGLTKNTAKSTGNNIEDVIIGNTNQAGEDSRNLARHAALLAGLPVTVGGLTVNRLCGSGMAAVIDASRAINCNEGQLYIAGGCESMSRAPWVMAKAESAFSRDQKIEDSMIGSRFPNTLITEQFGNPTMPQTADNIAVDLNINRERCDQFAYNSQRKYAAAKSAGFFTDEILPISTPGDKPRSERIVVDQDEHPRPSVQLEKLTSMSPLFADGVVTAGNASGINDGAAALLLGNISTQDSFGCTPKARIIASAIAGIEPRVMGLGPVPACQKALKRAGLSLADMDVIEINEAFAVQVLGCMQLMGLDDNDSRVNPNGGAIAIGHPLGASGARLILTAQRQLERIQGRYALASMCIGVGQGIAIIIERL